MTVLKMTIYTRIVLFFALSLTACVVVKNPPPNKPFLYRTNVHVDGKFSDDDRKELEAQLADQLHDSVRVKTVAKFAGWDKGPKLLYEVLSNPTVFDSLHAEKSLQFMHDLLHARGYYRDSVSYRVKIDTIKGGKELRTSVDFFARPGIVTRLDSIAYKLNGDTTLASSRQQRALDTLQKVTLESLKETAIKKGDPFSKYTLSAERDRLANVYRNNGYLRFSEEEMLVLWDTVGIELLRPTIDPIEQAQLLQRQAQRRASPVADIEFRLRENPDSTRITRYFVGNVNIYPELPTDTSDVYRYNDTVSGYVVRQNLRQFKPRIFPDYVFLNHGDLYRLNNVLQTQGKFNTLNAWRTVNILQRPRPGQDTADFDIVLTPRSKYHLNPSGEISYNRSAITIAQGNLIGLAFNASLVNRNFAHAANQSSFTFRYGTELNANIRDLIQTRQVNVGYNLQIPRLVPKFMRRLNKRKENTVTTIFTLAAGRTDRKDYFSLTTLNSAWGYQFSWNNKLVNFRFPNIEYNYLQKRDSLDSLISRNKSYAYIFTTGVIVSLPASFSIVQNSGDATRVTTMNIELAGLPGFLRNAFATNLYRFVRFDIERRQTRKLFRDALAWRLFAGAGWGLPFSSVDNANRFLPFYRQYFAGGPNSMRAWSVRKLGPGSAIKSFERNKNPDRFGDVRLEGDIEYRKYLTNYRGIGINTALFTDIGNVWFLRDNPDFPGGRFPDSFQKLWKDLAIGVGTGFRVDFGFFKFRLDYAYKLKNPTPDTIEAQNKWFYGWQLLNGQLQLGIDYPF